MIIVLFIFKFIPITLTAAGIAGFIISIGVAIDANILIFERMKEEIKSGKTILNAVEEGYDRA
jgi:preprotein translocase subunit SecD